MSKTCQDALEHEIKVQEFYQAQMAGNSSAILERLKCQKAQADKASYDEGRREGFRFGTTADYGLLMTAERFRWEIEGHFLNMENVSIGDFLTYKFDIDSFDVYFDFCEASKNDNKWDSSSQSMKDEFIYGFLRGLLDFWDSVKKDVEPDAVESVAVEPDAVESVAVVEVGTAGQ